MGFFLDKFLFMSEIHLTFAGDRIEKHSISITLDVDRTNPGHPTVSKQCQPIG